MKLVNCPVCGKRCNADTEKCPECGFEIRQYFKNEHIKKSKKKSSIPVICAFVFLVMIFLSFLLLKPKAKVAKKEVPIETINKTTSTSVSAYETTTMTTDLAESVTAFTAAMDPTTVASETQEITSSSAAVQETTALSTPISSEIDVSGVYAGDDHEILVLNSDGLAYYFCFTIQYTELACPWYIKDDNVYIEFSRLHCTVVSRADDNELLFKSDSGNWNTELFTRLNVEPEQYLTKIPSTNDPMASMNPDGTLNYTLDNITYVLPKTFMDFKDEFDSMDDTSTFIDQDAQSDFLASVTFHKTFGIGLNETIAEILVKTFASGFYKNITVSDCTETEVAGNKGFRFRITGYLNKGFSVLEGYEMEGSVTIFHNESTGNDNYIMMVQTANRALDDTVAFEEILRSAK